MKYNDTYYPTRGSPLPGALSIYPTVNMYSCKNAGYVIHNEEQYKMCTYCNPPNFLKWDKFYLEMAKHVSTQSKDPSTQCGAVIVRPDKTLVSVGFNGFPKKMPDKPEWYNNREEKYSRVVHCEMNALIFAREPLDGCTLYTYPLACCDRCAVHMIQAGISTFVFPSLPDDKVERWGKALEKTMQYYRECGVSTREIKNFS